MAQQQQQTVQTDDVNDWINRAKDFINKPATITAPAPANAQPWYTDFFGCFDPIDTCLITCFCPCVTFGKTHHRLRKSPTLEGYSPINASCLGFGFLHCCAINIFMNVLQRHELRTKYNLQGDFVTDCLTTWCCVCCNLIQTEKEAEYRALHNPAPVVAQEVKPAEGMTYPGGSA